jgi:hypothetical protein
LQTSPHRPVAALETALERSELRHHMPKPARANRSDHQRTSQTLNINFTCDINNNARLARNRVAPLLGLVLQSVVLELTLKNKFWAMWLNSGF